MIETAKIQPGASTLHHSSQGRMETIPPRAGRPAVQQTPDVVNAPVHDPGTVTATSPTFDMRRVGVATPLTGRGRNPL